MTDNTEMRDATVDAERVLSRCHSTLGRLVDNMNDDVVPLEEAVSRAQQTVEECIPALQSYKEWLDGIDTSSRN